MEGGAEVTDQLGLNLTGFNLKKGGQKNFCQWMGNIELEKLRQDKVWA